MNPKISIVIVTWNIKDILKRCLDSIEQYGDVPYELFKHLNARLEPSRKIEILLKPVSRSEFPRTAKMPKYSILRNTKFPPLRDWKEALHEFLNRQDSGFKI